MAAQENANTHERENKTLPHGRLLETIATAGNSTLIPTSLFNFVSHARNTDDFVRAAACQSSGSLLQALGPIQNYVELTRHRACAALNHQEALAVW